jgi:hypothetical protein
MQGSAPGLPLPTNPGHMALCNFGKLFVLIGAFVSSLDLSSCGFTARNAGDATLANSPAVLNKNFQRKQSAKRPFEFDRVRKNGHLVEMKRIEARNFQKQFGKISRSLKEGETVEITEGGRPVGEFRRSKKFKCPDFAALLRKRSCSKEIGDQLLREFNEALS